VLHYGDLTDASSLIRIVQEVKPDEIYNLAAQSHVKVSFEQPEYTADAMRSVLCAFWRRSELQAWRKSRVSTRRRLQSSTA